MTNNVYDTMLERVAKRSEILRAKDQILNQVPAALVTSCTQNWGIPHERCNIGMVEDRQFRECWVQANNGEIHFSIRFQFPVPDGYSVESTHLFAGKIEHGHILLSAFGTQFQCPASPDLDCSWFDTCAITAYKFVQEDIA